MKLSKILDRIDGFKLQGNIEEEVKEIRCDSRLVEPGDMFVAIVGFKTNGHEYVEMALQKGASVIAVQDGEFDVSKIPTKNIILNTEPIIDPSLWKLVPKGMVVSAISSETPIFFVDSIFIGIHAALEHVPIAVTVAGITCFQNALNPFFPPAIKAYIVYIIK